MRPEVIEPKLRPGYTLLHEYVVDAATAEPIAGARVRLIEAGIETQTDVRGHFWLSVRTPRPPTPGGMGTDTLVFEKPGYKTITVSNFGITDEEMGGVAVEMERGSGRVERDATHKLLEKQPEGRGKEADGNGTGLEASWGPTASAWFSTLC
jgi:hypothetical protein